MDHKGLLVALLGEPKGAKMSAKAGMKHAEPDGDEVPKSDEDKMALADAVFDAVKSGDREGFHDALHAYVMACLAGEPDGDEGESAA